jgi:hypothetical protein
MTILFDLASPYARYLHKATCFTQREEILKEREKLSRCMVAIREIREGWPLLTNA